MNNEKGQTLVLFVLLLFGFIGMLALVIDGGYAYYNRRIVQDAADAAALAGARVYCIEGRNINTSKDTALQYAAANGADPGSREDIIINTLEPYTVTANTSVEFSTFFANLLGRPSAEASASATAGCLPPTQAAPLPIAFYCRPDPDDYCGIKVWDPLDHGGQLVPEWDPYDVEGNPVPIDEDSDESYYVIVLDSDDESLISCQPEGDLNCDFDGDGKTDLISGDDRSWLDLDGSSANTNDLRAFITGDKETTIRIHTWVPKSSGLAASLYGDIYDQWVSGFDTYVIPVYADVCDQNPEGYSPPCSYNPDTDTIIYVPDTSRDYYYIVSFGLFRVTCVNPMGHSSSCDVFDYLVETYTGNSAPFENKTASVEGYYTPATSEDIDAILSGTYYGTSSYVIKLID